MLSSGGAWLIIIIVALIILRPIINQLFQNVGMTFKDVSTVDEGRC